MNQQLQTMAIHGDTMEGPPGGGGAGPPRSVDVVHVQSGAAHGPPVGWKPSDLKGGVGVLGSGARHGQQDHPGSWRASGPTRGRHGQNGGGGQAELPGSGGGGPCQPGGKIHGSWAAMLSSSLPTCWRKNVLEVILEKDERGSFYVSEKDCARMMQKVGLGFMSRLSRSALMAEE